MNNHSIRKIAIATGAVTTLAGREGGNFGDQDGIGSEAGFFYPAGITTDGINLYVADSYNHAVRKIVIATKSVSTLAGSMSSGSADGTGTDAEFNLLKGITIADENLYVTDTSNTTIRKIVISSGAVTTFAGIVDSSLGDEDGIGTEASFAYPTGITSDGSNLYVVDSSSNTVRKIVIATREVTTIAGTAPRFGHVDDTAEAARFDFPVSITTDGKSLYISDRDNNAIRKID
jgi:sugar lactone lactonase YvrE